MERNDCFYFNVRLLNIYLFLNIIKYVLGFKLYFIRFFYYDKKRYFMKIYVKFVFFIV